MSENFFDEKAEKAEKIMLGMGFPSTENGEYVNALRKEVLEMIERGVTYVSPGTWKDSAIFFDHEERARHLLQFWWTINLDLSYRRELIDDPPLTFMKKRARGSDIYINVIEVHPKSVIPWIRDQFRKLTYYFWKSYNWLFNVQNPYAKKKDS